MKASELIKKAIDCATNYKTLYVMGCFGAPMTEKNKKRYTQNNAYNKQPSRTEKINNATADTFGFDCVCLFKGLLWGWNGNKDALYGGAVYASNGLPDTTIKAIANSCTDVSTDFTHVEAGEFLWNESYGHCGICVGYVNGKLCKVESTPGKADGVQLFEMTKGNKFVAHGKSCYVEYDVKDEPSEQTQTVTFPVIAVQKGSKGADVLRVQQILKGSGYYSGNLDGDCATKTVAAIKAYQQRYKLYLDGVWGKKCWEHWLDL